MEWVKRVKLTDGLLVGGLMLLIVGLGMNLKNVEGVKSNQAQVIKKEVSVGVTQVSIEVMFDIEGEVRKPGVYRLPKGARMDEAIKIAGGLNEKADSEWVETELNRAEVIVDGQKIYIPAKGVVLGVGNGYKPFRTQSVAKSSGLVRINTAGVEELDTLPGIGPKIAERIINYRNENGGFKDINELKLVSGIGDKLFEKIKDKIGL